jgi:integrase
VLKDWLGDRREGRVFPPVTPGRWTGGVWCRGTGVDLGKVMARVEKTAGIEIGGVHSLRHHYASWLAMNGFTEREIQEILGHSSVRTTERYTHVASDFLARARARIDKAMTVGGGLRGGLRRDLTGVARGA